MNRKQVILVGMFVGFMAFLGVAVALTYLGDIQLPYSIVENTMEPTTVTLPPTELLAGVGSTESEDIDADVTIVAVSDITVTLSDSLDFASFTAFSCTIDLKKHDSTTVYSVTVDETTSIKKLMSIPIGVYDVCVGYSYTTAIDPLPGTITVLFQYESA